MLIDAGYLLAAGGLLTCGTSNRSGFSCTYGRAVEALAEFTTEHSGGLATLRTYWYDGAPDAVPTPEHLKIGALPYVKVRLGRVIQGEQKGVDALIYRDLMTLARERAIARAYVVSGDEDLREGVVAAQDMGVQVILIGIPTSQRSNQSAALIREVDEHVVLPDSFWSPFFALKTEAAEEFVSSGATAHASGYAFGREWARNSLAGQVEELLADRPRIPRDLDIQLIVNAEADLGSLRDRQELKYELRAGFWAAIEEHAATHGRTS